MTHDYRIRGWGHDISYSILPNNRILAHGWGKDISLGDYLLLEARLGETRYQVDEIDYYVDPPDMFKAIMSFAPR